MSDPHHAAHVAELERVIRHHNRLYWDEHAPEISDEAYDALVRELKRLAPDSPVLAEMGPSVRSAFRHTHPMLSLDKCYSDAELREWTTSFSGDVVAMPKYDGIACALHYGPTGDLKVAATRGDGTVGDDITENALGIRDIPPRIPSDRPLEVRGEIYMRLSVFERYRAEGMANPRNLAAGAIKQKSAAKSAAYNLSFAAYDLLGGDERTQSEELDRLVELGFPAIDARVIEADEAPETFARFAELRPTLDYEIDGVVFIANAKAEQRRLGATAHHPRYALAYKFQGDAGVTTLREVEWSVARTGAITPVAHVEPVVLSGVTVSRASLHNVAFIDRLGLSIGAKVLVVRRGGVIPNVEQVTEPGTVAVQTPSTCPSCGAPTVRERDFLYCSAPLGCKRAILGQLGHFAATVEMLGFGDVLLEQCFEAGLLRGPADFYGLTADALAKLPRCGDKLAQKLVREVNKKRVLDLAVFLRALGISELGKHISSVLASKYHTLDGVLGATEDELVATHSIGATIAREVVTGLRAAAPTIGALRKHVDVRPHAAREQGGTGRLAGKSFVFTGKLVAFSRSEAEAHVRRLGGDVHSSVTKSLTYLVVGADKSGPKSTKEKAAEKLLAQGVGLSVIDEEEFLQMIRD